MTDCPLCREGVSHCHGTLLVHTYYETVCSDPECRELDVERHDLVIDLADED